MLPNSLERASEIISGKEEGTFTTQPLAGAEAGRPPRTEGWMRSEHLETVRSIT